MPKTCRVARLNEPMSEEVAFLDEATIDDVLAHFGESLAKGESLAIDGETVNGQDIAKDGDRIFIVPSTTGM